MSTTQIKDTVRAPIYLDNGKSFTATSNLSKELDVVPVIDVAGIYSTELKTRRAVAEQVYEAATKIGFFYAKNHGIDRSGFNRCIEMGKKFFSLPDEQKNKINTELFPDEFIGYHAKNTYSRAEQRYKDLSEAFNWCYDATYDPENDPETEAPPTTNVWPEKVPEMKDALMGYWTELLMWSRRFTRILALALHMPEEYFDAYIKRPEASMRIMHYPEQKVSRDDQNGIGAHTDFTSFTIVTQDSQSGLEVLSKSGAWVQVKPIPDTFVINIGDCLMRQTNDVFVSTIHRVINQSGADRYSVPFFFGFDREMPLVPVPSCISHENPVKYPLMTAGDYLRFRVNTTKGTRTS
ncbi:putative iron/ascorbate oxidoreductase [Penicillium rolfsii]|nr:putative iron/ascorbate oxidoreductase [Penicillium rolfsii]